MNTINHRTSTNHQILEVHQADIDIFICRRDVMPEWREIPATSFFRFYYPKEVCAALTYQDSEIVLEPDHGYLVAPGTTACAHQKKPTDMFYINFAAPDHSTLHNIILPVADPLELINRMVETISKDLLSRSQNRNTELQVLSLIHYLLSVLPENASAHKSLQADLLLQIFDQIKAYPEYAYSNSKLAQTAHLSTSLFIKKFSETFGISPQHFVIEERCRKAAKLLLESELSIDNVALECGFQNRYYFSRIFKKYKTASPADFRKKHQKAYPHSSNTKDT